VSNAPSAELRIRLATEADLAAINEIYNHYVVNCICTWQVEPGTLEERKAWFAKRGAPHP